VVFIESFDVGILLPDRTSSMELLNGVRFAEVEEDDNV
jgi:hypothetical protein